VLDKLKGILKSILNLLVDWFFTKKNRSSSSIRQVGNNEDLREELDDSIIDDINDRIDNGV
jgi:hypothetical protein